MIEAANLVKRFDTKVALNNVTFKIGEGEIYGLIGSNGSGKSTLLRMISGVYYPDGGSLSVDNMKTFDNPALKSKIFFLADTPYFLNHANLMDMVDFYKRMYQDFSVERFNHLAEVFPLNKKARIATMSKGMQRQAALMLALSTCPKYLLLDEAFDGLDPVMREVLKRILAEDIASNNVTVIIASHNLRELEDLCDHVGLIHEGNIIFNDDLDVLKGGVHKIQMAFNLVPELNVFDELNLLKVEKTGSVIRLIAKGEKEEIMSFLQRFNPIFVESLTPTLEELFIYELGVTGYDVKTILQ